MTNSNVSGALVQDFDALMEELPYWAREYYLKGLIDQIRSALKEYVEIKSRPQVESKI